MLVCQYCDEEDSYDNTDIDPHGRGWWCNSCDGFVYSNKDSIKHRFTLILENKEGVKPVFQPPNIKFRKQLSPLRYPGGKGRLIDYLYTHLQQANTKTLISPFTGGGSFELSMLDAGVVEELHLNDLDFGIYSLWWTILHSHYALVDKIQSYRPTHKDYFHAQAIIKADYQGVNPIEAAWATLLVNRLAYSGISKAGPLGGKGGTQQALLSRWNPVELIRRIKHIHSLADRIHITQMDAVEFIQEAYWNNNATIFVDPPYVVKGKDLYNCFYTKQQHMNLSWQLDSLHRGMPGADLVVTYDYNEWLQNIYQYPKEVIVGRKYSI